MVLHVSIQNTRIKIKLLRVPKTRWEFNRRKYGLFKAGKVEIGTIEEVNNVSVTK